MITYRWPTDPIGRSSDHRVVPPSTLGCYDGITRSDAVAEMAALLAMAEQGTIDLGTLADLCLELGRVNSCQGWQTDLLGWLDDLDRIAGTSA